MAPLHRLQLPLSLAALTALALPASGCRVIGSVFRAGVGMGIIAVVLVIAIFGGLAAVLGRSARA
jgi:hypothetical protein